MAAALWMMVELRRRQNEEQEDRDRRIREETDRDLLADESRKKSSAGCSWENQLDSGD